MVLFLGSPYLNVHIGLETVEKASRTVALPLHYYFLRLVHSSVIKVPTSRSELLKHPHPASTRTYTRRQILLRLSPTTLTPPKCQLQRPPLHEEFMPNPILTIRLPVQRHVLNINIRIRSIKIHIPNRRRLVRDRRSYADGFKERRINQVHVLPWIGEQPDHGPGLESAHCTTVVVPWQTGGAVVEGAWDIEVCSLRGECRAAGIVIGIDCEEC